MVYTLVSFSQYRYGSLKKKTKRFYAVSLIPAKFHTLKFHPILTYTDACRIFFKVGSLRNDSGNDSTTNQWYDWLYEEK